MRGQMEKSCACILLQPCVHGCLAQLQTLASSPVTFFVILFFFFFSPASVYGWVKLPKHFGNNPAASPESLLLPLSTADCPSPSIWWSLPGITHPAGWWGMRVCTHTLLNAGKLGWKLEKSTIFICLSKCLFMCFVISPERLQRQQRKAARLHCSAFSRVWQKPSHFSLPKEKRSTASTHKYKNGLGVLWGRGKSGDCSRVYVKRI